nr:MAG TPA: hypothetical protein [Caudoviricetes sp.]
MLLFASTVYQSMTICHAFRRGTNCTLPQNPKRFFPAKV